MAVTSPEIRIAASWISEVSARTEHPAALHLKTALSAGPLIDRAIRSSASIVTAVSAKLSGNGGVDAVIGEPVGDRVLAFGLLNRRQHSRHTHRRGRTRAPSSTAAS